MTQSKDRGVLLRMPLSMYQQLMALSSSTGRTFADLAEQPIPASDDATDLHEGRGADHTRLVGGSEGQTRAPMGRRDEMRHTAPRMCPPSPGCFRWILLSAGADCVSGTLGAR